VKIPHQQPGQIVIVTIICGMVLLVISWTGPFHALSKTAWSDEQAKAYANASHKFHQLSHQSIHLPKREDHSSPFQVELAEAKVNYQELRQQLDHARSRPKYFRWFANGLGILLVGTGCLLWVVTRNNV
jgi:hypothetical protein